jgi:hypothetical protein
MGTLSRPVYTAAQWLFKAVIPSMTISSMNLASVAVGLATSSRDWDNMTAEGWIDNKRMMEMTGK